MRRKRDYKADLLADLRRDPAYAGQYLSAAKKDSKAAFLVALRDVAEARLGVGRIARKARLNRENLYRTLSVSGNPTLSTLDAVLKVLGFEIDFRPSAVPRAGSSTIGSGKAARKRR